MAGTRLCLVSCYYAFLPSLHICVRRGLCKDVREVEVRVGEKGRWRVYRTAICLLSLLYEKSSIVFLRKSRPACLPFCPLPIHQKSLSDLRL